MNNITQLTQSVQEIIKCNPYILKKVFRKQFNKLLFSPLQNINLDQIASRVIVINALNKYGLEENKDNIRAIL